MAASPEEYWVRLDMNSLEILNLRLHLYASDPSSPAEGLIWYNTTSHNPKVAVTKGSTSTNRSLIADDDDFHSRLNQVVTIQNDDEILIWDDSASLLDHQQKYRSIKVSDFASGLTLISNAYSTVVAETGDTSLPATGLDSLQIFGDGTILETTGYDLSINKIQIGFKSQNANLILAGPTSGSAIPTFRSLLDADMPASYAISNWNDAYSHSTTTTGNPHSVTMADIGYTVTDTVGDPGSDLYLVTEQGIRESIESIDKYLTRSDWNQNGFVNRDDTEISFVDATRTFTISLVTGITEFSYFLAGVEVTKTAAESLVIADTEGMHVIRYNSLGNLEEVVNPSSTDIHISIMERTLVCILYWDATNSEAIYVGEERHGYSMSPSTHIYLHYLEGLRYASGLGLTTMSVDQDGSLNAHAQFGIDAGAVSDEDIYRPISSITSTTGLPIYYMTGASGEWRRETNAGFSVLTADRTSATRLVYNEWTGTTWQLTEQSTKDFVLYHVFATTEKDNPIICVVGQDEYATKADARAGAITEIHNLTLNQILFPEIKAIATIIFQTTLTYTNDVNARVVSTDDGDDYMDWRLPSGGIVNTSVSSTIHADLSALDADDHLQYALLNGRTGDILKIDNLLEYTAGAGITAEGIKFEDTTIDFIGGNGVDIRDDGVQRIFMPGGKIILNYPDSGTVRIGGAAGNDTMTATYPTLVGNSAGYNLTTANYPTAVGAYSLYNLTSGQYMIGIGHHAGYYLTTGHRSVFLGAFSFHYPQTTAYNIGIGAFAGYKNNGSYNIFIGYMSGGAYATSDYSLNISNHNVGFGWYSLYNLTTGDNNWAGGDQALQNLTSGSRNLVAGLKAGYNYTTENDNIVFGYNMTGTVGDSYHIRIGVSNRSVIEGNATSGSEWMGTGYEMRTDTLNEYTTDAGIDIGSDVYLTSISADETETYLVAIDNSTGLLSKRTVSSIGGIVYPSAGIPISTGSAWGTSITDNSTNWNTAYTHSQLTSGNPHSVDYSELIGTLPVHATSHKTGGSDIILLDEFGTPTDNTNLNATSTYHGLLPKLSGNVNEVLSGAGTWISAPSSSSVIYDYRFSTVLTDVDPGAGKMKFNSGVYANVTYIFINDSLYNGIDAENSIGRIKDGDTIYVQSVSDINAAVLFDVTGDAVDGTGYWKIPVTYSDDGGTFLPNDANCFVSLNTEIAIFTATEAGIVPASGGGTEKFLRSDGAWVTVSGTDSSDGKVFADSLDPTSGYLSDKVDGTSFGVDTTTHKMYGHSHVVSDITARDAIPATQRAIGDICIVQNTDRGIPEIYQLIGGITNNDWGRENQIMSYTSYYPAIEVELEQTAMPYNAETDIIIGDISQNISVSIEYVLRRGTLSTKGTVEIENTDNVSDPDIHDERFSKTDIGITFDTYLSGNQIYLKVIIDNSINVNADIYYNAFRVMGTVTAEVTEFDFYVSNSGSDTNDGTTTQNAWKTIAKVNSMLGSVILPGHSVGFNRGDTFNDSTLDFTDISGTAGNPITIGAYGIGDKPKITGLQILSGTWTNEGSNVWSYDLTSLSAGDIRYLLSNGISMDMAKSATRFADTSSSGQFTDDDLGGITGDYNGSEVIMRTSNYTWEVRTVSSYTVSGTAGTVVLNQSTSYHLTELSTGNGGYFFQNSRKVLEQNSIQGEWAVEGNTLYFYSTTDPFNLTGDIEISIIDTIIDVDSSDYISIDNLSIEYASRYGIYSVGSNNSSITNCDISNSVWAIRNDYVNTNTSILNNTFSDIFNAIYLTSPTNATITGNDLLDIGLNIGINSYISSGSTYWGYDGIRISNSNGGLIQYNNLENIGYCGIKSSYTDGGILFKDNYVKNSNLILIDGGAYYTWEVDNVDKTGGTFEHNIAIYDAYLDTRYSQGRQDGLVGFTATGFYKDGYERNIIYKDNFAYGYENTYHANAATNCEWIDNIGAAPKAKEGDFVSPFTIVYSSSVGYVSNNVTITGNTFIAFANNTQPYWQRLIRLYDTNVQTSTGSTVDYNRYIQPSGYWYSSNHAIGYIYNDVSPDKDITNWRADVPIHGGHDQAEIMSMDLSGITDPEEFMWYATNNTKIVENVTFPAGYRYYNIDGDNITSDTLQPYEGKVYFRTIDEGMPQITTPSFTGTPIIGSTLTSISLSLIFSHEEGNSESGSTYQWYLSSDNTIEGRDPISGATSSTYVPLDSDGFDGTNYLILGIVPKAAADASGQLLTGVERFSDPIMIAVDADFYISNTGSDSNTGISVDQAWATLSKLNAEFVLNNIPAGSRIALERNSIFEGEYIDTFERDGASGNEIVFTSYGAGNDPIIKGTKALSGTWTEETGLGSNIWSFTDATITANIRHLIIDDTKQEMGYTDPAYFTAKVSMENVSTLTFADNGASNDTITDSASGFLAAGFRSGDQIVVQDTTSNNTDYLDVLTVTASTITVEAAESLTNETPASCTLYSKNSVIDTTRDGTDDYWKGGEIVYRSSQWTEEVKEIDSFEDAAGLIHWASPSSYYPRAALTTHKYVIQNHWRTLLSTHNPVQGNWAYDSTTNKIYVYSTSDPSTLGNVEITVIDRLADISNSDYIKFEDIDFQWNNSRAIYAENSTNVTIDNCQFNHGSRGIDFYGNASSGTNNIVTNTSLTDLSHNGIYYRNQINAYTDTCDLTDIGIQRGGSPGETIGFSNLDSWSHNGIDHHSVTGFVHAQYINIVNVGYCGIKTSGMTNNGCLIDRNYVKNALYRLSDGGAIYFVSNFDAGITSRDVTNNILEFEYNDSLELYVSSYKAHGIYSDRQNDDFNTQGNFVMGYQHGINLSYADNQDNTIQDNTVWTGITALNDSIHTRPVALEISHLTNSYGDNTNNILKNNILVTTYSHTLQDSITSSLLINVEGGLDPTTFNNTYSGNKHLALSGNNDIDYDDASIWIKYGSDAEISVEMWKDLWSSTSLIGDNELGWTPITYSMSGLSTIGENEHDQIYYDINPTKIARALILPSGYRYYDENGTRVTSGTLQPYKGKLLIKTINEGLPKFSTVSFTGTSEVNNQQTAIIDTTVYFHELGNLIDTTEYRWYISETNSIYNRRKLKYREDRTIAFNSLSNPTITDSSSKFLEKGFEAGDTIVVRGSYGNSNDGTYTILTVTAGTITLVSGDTLTTQSSGNHIVIECISNSTITPTSQMGFDGTTYLILGMTPKSLPGSGQLIEGIETFSSPVLIASTINTVVGSVIFNGDAGDKAGTNVYPALALYSNTMIATNGTRGITTSYAYQGTRSIYLQSSAAGDLKYGGKSFADSIQLYSGIKYRLSFWYYLPGSNDISGNIKVETVGPTNGTQTWADHVLVKDTWIKVECDLNYQGDETVALDIVVTAGSANAIIYYDNIEMGVLVSSVDTTEHVTNGDVESALPTINTYAFTTYLCTAVQSTDYAYSGTHSVKLTQTNGAPQIAEYWSTSQENSGLSAGWYKFSMRVYAPSAPNAWRLSDFGIMHENAAGINYRWGLGPYVTEDQWELQECIVYIDVSHNHLISFRAYDTLATGGGVCYIDDLSIKSVTLPSI